MLCTLVIFAQKRCSVRSWFWKKNVFFTKGAKLHCSSVISNLKLSIFFKIARITFRFSKSWKKEVKTPKLGVLSRYPLKLVKNDAHEFKVILNWSTYRRRSSLLWRRRLSVDLTFTWRWLAVTYRTLLAWFWLDD